MMDFNKMIGALVTIRFIKKAWTTQTMLAWWDDFCKKCRSKRTCRVGGCSNTNTFIDMVIEASHAYNYMDLEKMEREKKIIFLEIQVNREFFNLSSTPLEEKIPKLINMLELQGFRI